MCGFHWRQQVAHCELCVVFTELSVSVEVSGTLWIANSGFFAGCVNAGARGSAAQPDSEVIMSEEGMGSSSLCWQVLGGSGWIQFQSSGIRGGSLHVWVTAPPAVICLLLCFSDSSVAVALISCFPLSTS